MDSTGTIINDSPNNQGRPYYYALLLESETSESGQSKPTLPILEFISTIHNVPYLRFILADVAETLRQLNNTNSPLLRHIEIDFSMAEIQATLEAFNEMTVITYMQFVLNVLQDTDLSPLKSISIVHICFSHILATVKRHIYSLSKNENMKNYACCLITGIVHCIDLETAALIFKHAIILFQSKQYNQEVQESIKFFKNFNVHFEGDGGKDEVTEAVNVVSEEMEADKL